MRIINYLPVPFIDALAWSLLHSLWQILAIAILWKISLWFARKAPALIRQNLSIAAMLTIPVVFAITFIKQYNIYNSVERIAYLEFNSKNIPPIEATNAWYVLEKENSTFSQFFDTYTPFIFWLYWIGIALFSIYFFIAYSRLYSLKRNGIIMPPDSWSESIQRARIKSRTGNYIPLWLSTGVTVPVVVGFFKPVVLFPLAVSASLTMREVEDILLHEFYHIRCRDHYVNTMQYLMEILFFYHPCTWWISATLRTQRESKVDEWVVRQTENPLEYAQTLISLEEKRKTSLQPALAATSSYKSLLSRIKNIMHMKTRNFKPGQKIAAMMVIAFATISLAWLNPSSVFFGYTNDTEVMQRQPEPESQPEPQIVPTSAQTQPTPPEPEDETPAEPSRIVLQNGNTVEWEELSDEDKAEIRQAMREAQLAIREAMEEVRNELNSEENREELRQAREEIRQAMEEVNRELNSEEFKAEMRQAQEEVRRALAEVNTEFQSEEFREEMRQAQEEIRRALADVNSELQSEEFQQEMQKAQEEIRMAMQEVNRAFQDEEFKAEMRQVGVELQRALSELDSINWAEIGIDMNLIFTEVGKSLENLGPTLNEIFKDLELDSIPETDEN
jgi:bla regulator protein blaR1